MSNREDNTDLEAAAKERTRELRGEGTGYSKAVRTLAEELYRTARGKETRLAELGVTAESLGSLPGLAGGEGSSIAKTKKGKAKILGALETLVSPWVSDVYEEEPEG